MVKKINIKAFSLIEVMIAMAIFATFVVSFITGQGYNVLQSGAIHSDLELTQLTQLKLNEILIDPPDFKETLTTGSNSKRYEDHPGYSYQVIIKKNKLPDFKKLQGKQENDASSSGAQATIYNLVKTNLERLVWQLKVTVIRKETGEKYSLSTWLYNHKNDQVDFGGL